MKLPNFSESPIQIQLSFDQVIEKLRETAADPENMRALEAGQLLQEIALHPELSEGITEMEQIAENAALIRRILSDIFPPVLTKNEIKAVSIPYIDIVFNQTERFKNIMLAAGPGFDMTIRDFDEHQFYILTSCIILNRFYGTSLDFSKPLFYDIPAANGIMRHYRILYNADFLEVYPTERSVSLTQDDIDRLLNSYDDIDLWKQLFPKDSYIVKGFGTMTLVDVTVESAVSTLKGKLLNPSNEISFSGDFEDVFRSIYNVPDLRIGISAYDKEENKFSTQIFPQDVKSFLFSGRDKLVIDPLCTETMKLVHGKELYFAVSDCSQYLEEHPCNELVRHLAGQNVESLILAPLVKNDVLLGILEVVSYRKRELNSVNAHKLEVVMPFIADTIDRRITGFQNEVQAVIQNEYTTLHPSVQWKFRNEARKFIRNSHPGSEYMLKEIVFKDVYPLYGQVDIKGSTDARNLSVQRDLNNELAALIYIVKQIRSCEAGLVGELQKIMEFSTWLTAPSSTIKTDMEQQVQHFIETRIFPILKQVNKSDEKLYPAVKDYFDQLDKDHGDFYQYRRMYETTVSVINQKAAGWLDKRQADAQAMFPHYYERFKTDGVEHNLYIGASISPTSNFNADHLYNLRLWQLQVLCETEQEIHNFRQMLPYQLDVTTLILAFSSPLSIRFRMDEKRFDVDGTYNARFEMVKKRIDKACIKGTADRIVEVGKITIVYSNDSDAEEYKGYISQLQAKGMLGNDIEFLEVEDLPGVAGLKALRCRILH